jgi:hypothetical protein
MVALTFLATWPILFFSTLLKLIAPYVLYRNCETCDGEGYIPVPSDVPILIPCPTCEWGHRDCPDCMGSGLHKVEESLFQKCPHCDNGLWPRAWAWRLNLVPDMDGTWHSPAFDNLYHIYGKEHTHGWLSTDDHHR